MADHYATLGIPKDASADDVKRAYRKIAKENHPDSAGNDPAKLRKFKEASEAYEVLGDADARARYDRKSERVKMGSGFGFYRPPAPSQPTGAQAPSELDLEDIFNDFGGGGAEFGFGKRASTRSAPRQEPPTPGRDIPVFADVPAHIAEAGGSVIITYSRLKRVDGSKSLSRVEEIHDLKVPPNTPHGMTLRVEKMGDAGLNGGTYGDLIVDVTVLPPKPKPGTGRIKMPRVEPDPMADEVTDEQDRPVGEEHAKVDVDVFTCLLGGPILVPAHGGPVKVNVPAGTSSGARFRLKGRGVPDLAGRTQDLVAEVRIVVPKGLSELQRDLITRAKA